MAGAALVVHTRVRRGHRGGSIASWEVHMAVCEVCGNEYDGSFAVITTDRQEHIVDSIECA